MYYGRVLNFLRYEFNVDGTPLIKDLVFTQRAGEVVIKKCGEAYKPEGGDAVFRNPTVEDATTVSHSIGILEHGNTRAKREHTFFIDPHRGSRRLLENDEPGYDGVNRALVSARR